ncbi:hypothetical protein RIF23_00940 [Lipingzhangella sp. LS1_29]|uniref:Integral membrane protein n=1 Tax=Lipingzhangella rawalii TaxID=2055835 RepID=A0ABU2H0M6_9ACTN|nr:hypothetical protein [Lipingzhangella rawalii]MDS1268853.1 hypothetical protein [Lipingzhangella rawalii]
MSETGAHPTPPEPTTRHTPAPATTPRPGAALGTAASVTILTVLTSVLLTYGGLILLFGILAVQDTGSGWGEVFLWPLLLLGLLTLAAWLHSAWLRMLRVRLRRTITVAGLAWGTFAPFVFLPVVTSMVDAVVLAVGSAAVGGLTAFLVVSQQVDGPADTTSTPTSHLPAPR